MSVLLILVLVPLATAAFMLFRFAGDTSGAVSADAPVQEALVARSLNLASNSLDQAHATLTTQSTARTDLDSTAPALRTASADGTIAPGMKVGSEPAPAAFSPSSPVPPSPVARPAQVDAFADTTRPVGSPLTAAPSPKVAAPVRGVTDTEIRFGIAAPFTGASKELGRQMKMGIETAFNIANDAGGIHGRQLKLIAADDGYEPTRTAEAMKQLHEQHQVLGLVGNVGTPTAAVALPYALENKMLFLGAFTGANLLRNNPPDRYVFNFRPSYAEETEAVVRYLVKVRGLKPKEIAVFAQQDSYGDSGFAGVAKAMRALGEKDAKPAIRLNYQRNSVDVADAVAQLRAQGSTVKAVVMVATYRAAAKFIEKTRPLYPKMIYTNVSFVGSTALAEELTLLGPNFADGVIVTQVVPAVNGHSKAVLDFKTMLAKYFPGEKPDYVSFEGYVAAGILIEALKRAGPQPDTEKLVDALEGIRGLDLGLGTNINFGPSEHQGSRMVWGTQIDNTGRFNPIDLD